MSNDWTIMNDEFRRPWRVAVITQLKVPS